MTDALALDEGRAIKVQSFKRIDADRAVAHVDVGPFHIGSLWITGLASNTPVPSWPRTSRGYPIISVDEPLRGKIEQAVLAMAGLVPQPHHPDPGPVSPDKKTRPPRRRKQALEAVPFDDTLDGLSALDGG